MNKLQRIEEMEKQPAALKKEIVVEDEPMFPVIGDGNVYSHVCNEFEVDSFTNVVDRVDKALIGNANAFTDEKQARACGDYLKDRFWFIRKSIEFADGYEFRINVNNFYPCFMGGKWTLAYSYISKSNCIYMTEEAVNEFCEWLNKHKPNGFN